MRRKVGRTSEEKLYTVQYNDCCNFVAGFLPHGEQVLMGVVGDDPLYVVAAFFNKAGLFLRQESRSVSFPKKQGQPHGQIYEERVKALWLALEEWKAEIGIKPKGVRIARFHLPEWGYWGTGIGLCDLPQFMQDCSDDRLSEKDEQLRRELLDDIEQFRSNEKFVLRWGTEYWMSKEGEITDT